MAGGFHVGVKENENAPKKKMGLQGQMDGFFSWNQSYVFV